MNMYSASETSGWQFRAMGFKNDSFGPAVSVQLN